MRASQAQAYPGERSIFGHFLASLLIAEAPKEASQADATRMIDHVRRLPMMREQAIRPRGGMVDTGDLKSHSKTQISNDSSEIQKALAVSLPLDPDLARLVDAWPTLPEALRAGILAMIDAARK